MSVSSYISSLELHSYILSDTSIVNNINKLICFNSYVLGIITTLLLFMYLHKNTFASYTVQTSDRKLQLRPLSREFLPKIMQAAYSHNDRCLIKVPIYLAG